MMERLIAPDEFWIRVRAGVSVATASRAVGVSHVTGYRWLAEVGGPAALGLTRGLGRPWGGRASEQVREVFWAELRRGVTLIAVRVMFGLAPHLVDADERASAGGGRAT